MRVPLDIIDSDEQDPKHSYGGYSNIPVLPCLCLSAEEKDSGHLLQLPLRGNSREQVSNLQGVIYYSDFLLSILITGGRISRYLFQ
jgi:hypothetical protein